MKSNIVVPSFLLRSCRCYRLVNLDRRWLLSALIIIGVGVLSGCKNRDYVAFTPSKGDKQTYQVKTDTYVSISDMPSSTPDMTTLNLVRIQVASVDKDSIRFTLHHDYNEFTMGRQRMASDESPNSDKEWRAMMESGFSYAVDKKTGAVKDFSGLDKSQWQSFIKRHGEEYTRRLQRNSISGVVFEKIPTKLGTKVTLPEFYGHPSVLTVEAVSDDSITVRINDTGADKSVSFSGLAIIERENGWLKTLSMMTKQAFERYGQKGTMITEITLAVPSIALSEVQRYSPSPVVNDRAGNNEPEFFDFDSRTYPPVTVKPLIDNGVGVFGNNDHHLKLAYGSAIHDGENYGRYTLDKVEAVDSQGKSLPVKFWVTDSSIYSKEGGVMVSSFEVRPLGWHFAESLASTAGFKGELTYHPVDIVSKNITWQPDKSQQVKVGKLTVSIVPLSDTPNHYLVFANAKDGYLTPDIRGIWGKIALFPSKTRMTQLLEQTGQTLPPDLLNSYELILDGYSPTVTLFSMEKQPQQSVTKTVKFVGPEAYIKDPANPPLEQNVVRGAEEDASTTPFSIETLTPEVHQRNGLSLTIPVEWLSLCKLSITDGFLVNGHELKWLNANQFKGYWSKSVDTAAIQKLYLSTDDGVRQYFYGGSVTSDIQCHGKPVRQRFIPAVVADKPWLVDIKPLGPDVAEMPINQFVQNYYFLNSANEALSVFDSEKMQPVENTSSKTVRQFLTADGQLRLSGIVVSGMKITSEPFTYHRQWHHSFPPLPTEQ